MFWESFYKICKDKGTSPNAVCKSIGLSNAAATGWKSGTQPKADVLVKIADYLGCSVDCLMGRKAEITPQPEDKMLALLSQLSDESLIELEKYLDYLIWKQDQDGTSSE